MDNLPIVILHGWNLSASKFEPLVKLLKEKKFAVYCPDLPGFGHKRQINKVLRLEDYSNFLNQYLSGNNLAKIILICHSFGGRVGLKFLSKNEHSVKKVIFTGVPGFTPVKRIKVIFYAYLAKLGRLFFSLPLVNRFSGYARKVIYKMAGAMDYYHTDESMRETFENVVTEGLVDYMKAINIPALLIWGEKDAVVPPEVAQKMNRVIKNSRLQIINGVGHGLPYTHPHKFFLAVRQFLKQ